MNKPAPKNIETEQSENIPDEKQQTPVFQANNQI
jgi:hypothetical protein